MNNTPNITRNVTSFLAHGPWAITAAGAAEFVSRNAEESVLSAATARRQNIFGGPLVPEAVIRNGVAVIAINGPLLKGATLLDRLLGAVDYDDIDSALSLALFQDGVKSVLLHITSPGGMVAGSLELAQKIAGLKRFMPIRAAIDETCASAAYFLASACSEILITRTGQAGSVGVILQLTSFHQALKSMGIDVSVFVSDPPKSHGHPALPMSDDAREYFQGRVTTAADMFKSFVKSQRRSVSLDSMDGRMFWGDEAVAMGLADKIITSLDEAVQLSSSGIATGPRMQAAQFKDDAERLFQTDAALRSEFGDVELLRSYLRGVERGAVHDPKMAAKLSPTPTATIPAQTARRQNVYYRSDFTDAEMAALSVSTPSPIKVQSNQPAPALASVNLKATGAMTPEQAAAYGEELIAQGRAIIKSK